MKANRKNLLRYLPLVLWLLMLAANAVNLYQSEQYWTAQPPSDYAAQMRFEARLAFDLVLIYLSFPLGTAAVFLLVWLPEWLLPRHGASDNFYLVAVALLCTLCFYLQWYVVLPRLFRRWKQQRGKAA